MSNGFLSIVVVVAMSICVVVLVWLNRRAATRLDVAETATRILQQRIDRDPDTGVQSDQYFRTRLADGGFREQVVLLVIGLPQRRDTSNVDSQLRRIATQCRSVCRKNDFVARTSDTELCMVLHDCGLDEANAISRGLFDRSAAHDGPEAPQIGVSELRRDDLLDEALAAARHCEHNLARRPVRITSQDVDSGLRNEEFTYFVQTIFNVGSRQPVGVEMLMRWVQPDGTVRRPNEFMHLLRPHLSGADRAPSPEGRGVSKALNTTGPDLFCAFNVSLTALEHRFEPTSAWLDGLLMGIPPERAVLEIIENSAFEDSSPLQEMLRFLRKNGVRIALDDFGTGYSNFFRLCAIPVDIVKIDKSLVRDLANHPKQIAAIRSLITLGRELDFDLIAEGVETEAELLALHELGVEMAQGFHLARPQSIGDWTVAQSGNRFAKAPVRTAS